MITLLWLIISTVIAAVIHEAAHIVAIYALRLGKVIRIGIITKCYGLLAMPYCKLGIYEHIYGLRSTERRLILMHLAGPVTNLAAAIIVLFIAAFGGIYHIAMPYFFFVNLLFFVINILPLPMVDGLHIYRLGVGVGRINV